MDPSTDPKTVTLDYLTAVGQKRFDRVAELLHPDVDFRVPGNALRGAPAYLTALRRLGPILARNEVRQTIVDGNEVCAVYDFVTDTPAGAVPTVEWTTIQDGRIRSVQLIFDKTNWPLALAELARRSSAQVPAGVAG